MSELSNQKSYKTQIVVIAGLFSIFGFVTWINGALIPFMRVINELPVAQSYLVATASYISFVVMALPSSFVLEKIGYKNGFSLGLLIMAIGALIFIYASEARSYTLFLSGIFVQGSGMALLQTAANPYITILGPIESGAKRISIMGICNKLAGALGSLIFGTLLLSGIDKVEKRLVDISGAEKELLLSESANKVVVPYLIMAIGLAAFAFLIRLVKLPSLKESETDFHESSENAKKTIFQFPHLWLGVFALFLYVGAEVVAGDTIIAYGLSLGIPPNSAKFFTTFTLAAMVFTYSLGIFLIPKYISQARALCFSALLGIVFSCCVLLTKGFVSVLFVAALGMANALVWPSIWPLTLDGLGKHIKTASALLIMAIAGGAVIPPLYGLMVDDRKHHLIKHGLGEASASMQASNSSYWILIPCYLVILFYALKGHKLGLNKK